ncbi:MAG: alpha/beta hydrolase [Simplicispira suum]|uniref:alpha/beta fold hydrolase n=1 Tax=Simplicispira suum TaxID=2109915 RepID=UPI001C6BCEDE|nr:alpha/beta hydrolase [Simplicispira suum]MBW7833906.1 alpha/beta hydrolase [Simplicispira suum]
MYSERFPARTEVVRIRSLDYHVRRWGALQSDAPPLVLVHGWMDVGASYQFMVDALSEAFVQGRSIIAPDWRGFGLTKPPVPTDHYAFADYLADLDQLLDHYAGERPVDLVGHSMGGNIAMMYAGVRATRVRRLVNLEGFGLPASQPESAVRRYGEWMDEIRQLERGEMALKSYEGLNGVARRLMKTNPRLSQDKAEWLAQHWAAPDASGRWAILGDAAHKVKSAQLYRVDEVQALYAAIAAPTLAVEASGDSLGQWWQGRYTLAQYHERLKAVANCRTAVIEEAGHMLHHDQPEALAKLVEAFLSD